MQQFFNPRSCRIPAKLLIILSIVLFSAGCRKTPPIIAKQFQQVNLVANTNAYGAARIDPDFLNGWGIAFSPTGTPWVSSSNNGLSEVWNKDGNIVIPAVTIPSPGDAVSGGHPSGQVFNVTSDFLLPNGRAARFIFAGLDGIISGWNGGASAVTAIDASKNGAAFTGITIASVEGQPFLYAANFSSGKISVWDKTWAPVDMAFFDPSLPAGYAPFNIRNIGGVLYVMYAKVGSDGDEEKGHGLGYVDIFNPNGSLMKRFVSKAELNAPWGIAQAPDDFWGPDFEAHDVILVGNFGDGRINAYDQSGKFIGALKSKNKPIEIEGLWEITFAPTTATAVDPGWLYFAAGPEDEADGLFGYITK
ncbi:MAG: TIGR03118 family protein [Ginsengibacter sp.]